MLDLLKEGTKVRVHSLDWFEGAYEQVAGNNYNEKCYICPGNDHCFLSGMMEYCDKYVTIDSVCYNYHSSNSVTFRIKEDDNIYTWILEFFDLSSIIDSISCKIDDYCNNYCILSEECKLNNSKCELVSNNINIIYDYERRLIKYVAKVHSLEWFEKNCKKDYNVYILPDTYYRFVKGMEYFCGKYVTINKFYRDSVTSCRMKIEEDNGAWNWDLNFFEIRSNKFSIRSYCKNQCVFGGNGNCNNVECPLFNINKFK